MAETMTDHTKSAGEVEAREAAHAAARDKWRRNSYDVPTIANAAIDAYLAKLTPTKAEPSRIAEIRERKPVKMLITKEWLTKAIASDPDESCEAGVLHPEAPRFSIDHGVIHDRNTGKHVRTCDCVSPLEDGIQAALTLLNELDRDARLAPYLETALDHITAIEAERDFHKSNHEAHHAMWVSAEKELKRAEAENAAIRSSVVSTIDKAMSEIQSRQQMIADLTEKVRNLTTILDGQMGTPCEQIRHAQEIEDLKADRDRMREALASTRQRLYDCKHNAMFSSKDTVVAYVAEMLPRIDAALNPSKPGEG